MQVKRKADLIRKKEKLINHSLDVAAGRFFAEQFNYRFRYLLTSLALKTLKTY